MMANPSEGWLRVENMLSAFEISDWNPADRYKGLAQSIAADLDALTAARKAAEPLRGALASANNYRQISGSVPVLALIRILDALDGKAGA